MLREWWLRVEKWLRPDRETVTGDMDVWMRRLDAPDWLKRVVRLKPQDAERATEKGAMRVSQASLLIMRSRLPCAVMSKFMSGLASEGRKQTFIERSNGYLENQLMFHAENALLVHTTWFYFSLGEKYFLRLKKQRASPLPKPPWKVKSTDSKRVSD